MNFTQYEELARRTCKELPFEEHIEHMCMGIIGEVGELVDAYKKHKIYDKELDLVNLKEELGDVSWYVIGLCKELNVDPKACEDAFTHFKAEESLLLRISTDIVYMASIVSCYTAIADGPMKSSGLMLCVLGLWENIHKLCYILNLDIKDVMTTNINKLAARYGDKYSDYAAVTRDLETERKVLEA